MDGALQEIVFGYSEVHKLWISADSKSETSCVPTLTVIALLHCSSLTINILNWAYPGIVIATPGEAQFRKLKTSPRTDVVIHWRTATSLRGSTPLPNTELLASQFPTVPFANLLLVLH